MKYNWLGVKSNNLPYFSCSISGFLGHWSVGCILLFKQIVFWFKSKETVDSASPLCLRWNNYFVDIYLDCHWNSYIIQDNKHCTSVNFHFHILREKDANAWLIRIKIVLLWNEKWIGRQLVLTRKHLTNKMQHFIINLDSGVTNTIWFSTNIIPCLAISKISSLLISVFETVVFSDNNTSEYCVDPFSNSVTSPNSRKFTWTKF